MDKIKVLVSGDGGCYTGFSRVLHSIIENLPEDEYDIHHLAINYRGDPWPLKPWHKLYPASLGGDLIGIKRFKVMINNLNPDVIFILNDLWLIDALLDLLDAKTKAKVVCYFPVDAFDSDPVWVRYLPDVYKAVAYTEFGRKEVLKLNSNLDIGVIPHGVDSSKFYPTKKEDARKVLGLSDKDFIILNANRNQPRKRIDLTFKAFAKFSENKPHNVKLYLHMGVQDEGWNLIRMAQRYKLEERLILTSLELSPVAGVPDSRLNAIYNACDIGLNTSLGEGWGLPNMEHASVGKVQVVPNSSAQAEIYKDIGLLIDIKDQYTYPGALTTGLVVDIDSIVNKLNLLYYAEDIREDLSIKSFEYFLQDKFKWSEIAKQWDALFKEVKTNVKFVPQEYG